MLSSFHYENCSIILLSAPIVSSETLVRTLEKLDVVVVDLETEIMKQPKVCDGRGLSPCTITICRQ